MTDKKQPEALRLADALERPGYGWHSTPAQCAAELRRQYAERETLRASHGQAPAQPVAEPAQVSAVESNTVGAVLSNKGLTPELAAALQRGADGVFDLLKDWHLINKDAKAGRRLWQIGRNLEGIFGCALRGDYTRASSAPAQPAPQQEAQEPSHRETVDVVGVRSNGEHVNLEKIAMPPRMKAREIAIEQFGSFKDDDGSDAEMCFGALEYFLEWLIQQGWSKAPQPAPAPLSDDVVKDAARYRWLREGNDAKHSAAWHVARYRWLREGNDAKHSAAWHVAVNLYGCEWDAAIDAARAAQEGKL